MASSKYKCFHRKKLNSELCMVVSSLRKENAYLKTALVELSRQHSKHYKLVEGFLSLEIVRLENYQHQTAGDEKPALPSERLGEMEGSLMDAVNTQRTVPSYTKEMEDIKNKLLSVSTTCQYPEKDVAGKKGSASNEQGSTVTVKELQSHLRDALEKNKLWLEYDQQREAYVRAILARMLWLEKQLNEANQARSQQHNEDHSDEKTQICELQEHYGRLLQKTKDELEVLREMVDMTHQKLKITQNWCKEREIEMEELKKQLKPGEIIKESTPEDQHCSENEEQQLKDLQCRLDEEKCRLANFELQAKFMEKHHHADQKKIAELERQIKISSQDLEDEKQDCSYLRKQMVKILKTLQKTKDHATKQSKRDEPDHDSCEVTRPPSLVSRQCLTSSAHSSVLDESFLECPGCQAEYPASHYRELMNHLEVCLD